MKPKVNTKCVANNYASPNERIIEVSDQAGHGCLISVRSLDDGRLAVEVYREDSNVIVRTQAPTQNHA